MSTSPGHSPEGDEATETRGGTIPTQEGRPSDRQPEANSVHEGSRPPGDHPIRAFGTDGPGTATSSAQAEANRRNAKKSTGPTSAAGKRRSAMNAMTHGIYAQAQAIPRGILAESTDEVDQYVGAIVEALAPRDAEEMVLAQRIATADLRLARLERYESVGMAKIGRYIPGHDVREFEIDAAGRNATVAMRVVQYFRYKLQIDDIEMWRDIAVAIWEMFDTPPIARLQPDIPDDHPQAAATWERFVINELISSKWPKVEDACNAFEAAYSMWMGFALEHEGKAEERAVGFALAKGGLLDSASVLRARVQRERDRDRSTYAKLQERALADDEQGKTEEVA